jgi:hypothetical protein
MYEQIIVWVAVALLALLCFPIAAFRNAVLTVYAWTLRLTLLTLLGAGAYLWFRPEDLPPTVSDTLSQVPWANMRLPEPGMQNFGLAAAALTVAILLPWLMVLDACSHAAGAQRRRIGIDTEEPPPAAVLRRGSALSLRRIDGRTAADTLAAAAARKPSPAVKRLEH